jgi:acyl carrier protein
MSTEPSKICRDRLTLRRPYVAPHSATEQQLAEIWCTVLNLDRVGVEDHYIDLGGDSFLAVMMFEFVAQKLGTVIPTATLIAAPTIAQLARVIDGTSQGAERSSEPSGNAS